MPMNVITAATLRQAAEAYPDARAALEEWYTIVRHSEFASFAEIRATFPAASWVGPDYVIFNIRGNHYRLIVRANLTYKSFFVKAFLTHRDYDNWRP
ncbi:type II toxin-antitoxin system HigB family toxin [Deinococcus rubellus]|uniref:type II toxin-antitoxin system HigB family toxin n=1 Tax=Deinococcus rubellus TaxID=1889240 RepID=UPI0031EEEE34